jgi:hypothetical protein
VQVWKLIGLAGAAGVAASGAVLARSERQRQSYTSAQVRGRLHQRFGEVPLGDHDAEDAAKATVAASRPARPNPAEVARRLREAATAAPRAALDAQRSAVANLPGPLDVGQAMWQAQTGAINAAGRMPGARAVQSAVVRTPGVDQVAARLPNPLRDRPDLPPPMPLAQALEHTRTGDLWLFRGNSVADRVIRTATNSPVNHVGMAVVLDDLPPLIFHAELGKSLEDVWTGKNHRGVQLHYLQDAVLRWCHVYGQSAWLRQISPEVDRDAEDGMLRAIARLDGTPFPKTADLARRWVFNRRPVAAGRRAVEATGLPTLARDSLVMAGITELSGSPESLESVYCSEVVAETYQAMGLLSRDQPASWYDPGRFSSVDGLQLIGHELAVEIAVEVPPPPPSTDADPVGGPPPQVAATGAGDAGTGDPTEV